jgi:hypothetical protein
MCLSVSVVLPQTDASEMPHLHFNPFPDRVLTYHALSATRTLADDNPDRGIARDQRCAHLLRALLHSGAQIIVRRAIRS